MENTPATDTRFFGHPRGLATLFFTEMWERYSYYGTRALLILFMTAGVATGGLGFSVAKAGAVYGFYTAMVYLLTVPGGWVADRIIGQRRAVLYGGILISAGNFCLAATSVTVFYAGLGLLMVGTGLLKANVSTLVGGLYAAGDIRRDSGFSIFYMGINLGAFGSPLICGAVASWYGWRWGFVTSALGMLAGLVQYALSGKYLGSAGLHAFSSGDPVRDRKQKRNGAMVALGGVAVIIVLAALVSAGVIQITANSISNWLGWGLVLISGVVFSWMIFNKGWSAEERKRAVAIFVLFISAAIFWASFEQAGSSLNLFGEHNTNRHIFGYEFPAAWFQSVQPLLVIILAPVFAWLWLALGRRQLEPSSPAKFTLGLFFGGLAFAIMVPAAYGGQVSPFWLIGCYLLQTIGELCLSPVGLSAMTKLAPARAVGFIMGIWFLASSIGNWLAGKAGSLFESMPLPSLFGWVAGIAFAAALVLALLIKPTKRMMSGVN
ncbi:MAG TPA: oligopeptide:H+ symporter [Candidatus Angelobacter sp.]|jgi:POT family proton-dependent oligopeptide transporter|nr:oligopeptide:H+ symporter [Candidatus Angelobacter sp.]